MIELRLQEVMGLRYIVQSIIPAEVREVIPLTELRALTVRKIITAEVMKEEEDIKDLNTCTGIITEDEISFEMIIVQETKIGKAEELKKIIIHNAINLNQGPIPLIVEDIIHRRGPIPLPVEDILRRRDPILLHPEAQDLHVQIMEVEVVINQEKEDN